MSNKTTPPYGLDPERFAVVDEELRRAEAYFTRLRDEIQDAAADVNKQSVTVRHAEMVIEAIQTLRRDLAQEQAWRARGAPG